jgi:hypothetical protein
MTNGLSRRARNAVIWVAVTTIGLIGVLIFLGGILLDPKGEPIIEKPETLIGTIITAFSALMAILLPAILKAEQNTEDVKEEVSTPANGDEHATLREVMTDAIEVVRSEVSDVKDTVDGVQADVRGMRRDIGRVSDVQVHASVERRELFRRIGHVERKQDDGLRRLSGVERKEETDGPDAP